VLPQLDAFVVELVDAWCADEPVVVAGNSLGGCIALRLAEHPGELPIAGVVPVAPDGIEMPGWFDRIERDPIVRKLLAIPVAVPGALVRAALGRSDFAHPRDGQRAVVQAFSGGLEANADIGWLMEEGRRLLPELTSAPFDLAGIRCPVMLVWGDRDRLMPHTGARNVLDSLPTTQVELIEGCGAAPQVEATQRLLELLLPFPQVRLR
jgi:pimeloyl-ACP methyl ester carboxylesterase